MLNHWCSIFCCWTTIQKAKAHTHNINRRSHLGMRQNSGFQNCWDAWMISYSAIHSHQTFGWCVATPPKTLRFYPFEVFLKVSAPDFPNPICLKLWLKSHGLSSCSIMVFKTYDFDKFWSTLGLSIRKKLLFLISIVLLCSISPRISLRFFQFHMIQRCLAAPPKAGSPDLRGLPGFDSCRAAAATMGPATPASRGEEIPRGEDMLRSSDPSKPLQLWWKHNCPLKTSFTWIYELVVISIWAISKTLGSRKAHPQIWEGPIAYHTFVHLGGIACRKLLHLYIIHRNQRPIWVSLIWILEKYNDITITLKRGIANLGRSHRLPCVF